MNHSLIILIFSVLTIMASLSMLFSAQIKAINSFSTAIEKRIITKSSKDFIYEKLKLLEKYPEDFSLFVNQMDIEIEVNNITDKFSYSNTTSDTNYSLIEFYITDQPLCIFFLFNNKTKQILKCQRIYG